MKRIGIIGFLIMYSFWAISQTNFSNNQSLAGTVWMVDNLMADKINTFKLYPKKETENYGVFLQFSDSLQFKSYNQGSCGTECRQMVNGTYSFTNDGKLKLYIAQINYWKLCAGTPPLKINKEIGIFTCNQNGDTIVLQKEIAYDLSTPQKSLQTLCAVLQLQDTVELKKVVSSFGYEVLMKERGLKKLKANAVAWLAAIRAKSISIKYQSKETANEIPYIFLEVVAKISPKTGTSDVMSFSKAKSSNEWKFVLFVREE